MGLATALLLGSLVKVASARNLSVENRTIRAVWRELTFEQKPESTPAVGAIRCAVTLEGSFHGSTFAKLNGALIGLITRAIVAHPCTAPGGKEFWFHNGSETVLGIRPATSLPWPITYSGFGGLLPGITEMYVAITGIVMSVFYAAPLLGCLDVYGSATETRPWVFHIGIGGGIVESLEPEATVGRVHLIRRQSAMNGACPSLAKLSRPSEPLTVLGTTNQIRLHLI